MHELGTVFKILSAIEEGVIAYIYIIYMCVYVCIYINYII